MRTHTFHWHRANEATSNLWVITGGKLVNRCCSKANDSRGMVTHFWRRKGSCSYVTRASWRLSHSSVASLKFQCPFQRMSEVQISILLASRFGSGFQLARAGPDSDSKKAGSIPLRSAKLIQHRSKPSQPLSWMPFKAVFTKIHWDIEGYPVPIHFFFIRIWIRISARRSRIHLKGVFGAG